MLPKNCWPRVLGSVVTQLYAGECMPSVDWALTSVPSMVRKMRNLRRTSTNLTKLWN